MRAALSIIAEDALNDTDVSTAESVHILGKICVAEMKISDASTYFRLALHMREKIFGSVAVPTAEVLEDLALTVRRLEQAGDDDDEMPPVELGLDDFEPGAMVRHPKHGEGLVTSHAEGRVQVDFGGGNAHGYRLESLQIGRAHV